MQYPQVVNSIDSQRLGRDAAILFRLLRGLLLPEIGGEMSFIITVPWVTW